MAPVTDAFSPAELARYRRQITLGEVGLEGQQKLRAARVLVVGTGGLGSPVALYLAAAGVGTLGLVDFDRVDATNLHRQVLHGTASVGVPKVDSARARLHDLNPHVRVITYDTALTSANALDIVRAYDLVVDGTDNFPTRYLLSDACVLLGKPNVYGSVQRFEGQASIFCTPTGPCYRCLFREPPPPGLVPNCAEAGVFGVMPGLVGMIQATEAIKWILGLGTTLDGRLMLIDAMRMGTRTITLRRDPECPACGTRTITTLVDYEQFCGVRHDGSPLVDEPLPDELAPADAVPRLAAGAFLLDVREPFEAEIAAIGGATLVPMRQVPQRLAEIPRDRDVIVHCHHGMRSRSVVEYLRSQGYTRIANLAGGIDRWSRDVDPGVPTY
ncbi:MAG: molybdopterin-synthase adenylyltransferase MoeB [Gemmatimonadetes bacterium]|nr:molybdopterin-synthase adenylyltransferase MoeB [Gemmatimonadota bacterium]